MKEYLKRWGAAYILFALWVTSWTLHYHTKYRVEVSEAKEHGQSFEHGDFVLEWLSESFENLSSEWAQLFVQVVIVVGAAALLFKKSKEDADRIEAKVDQLLSQQESLPSKEVG